MIVPVSVDGKPMRWQLDTGADFNMTYGDVADKAGLSGPDDSRFPVRTLQIGSTKITGSLAFIRREMSSDDGISGTLGLNSLVGRIAVIDYPAQKFCLFTEASFPQALKSATYTKMVLRDRKIFVPIKVGGFNSDAVLFDTGSSEMPLNVDMPIWTRLSGKKSVDRAEKRIEGQAWGVDITLFGAPSAEEMHLGDINLGKQDIYTERTDDTFAAKSYRIDGIMGNASVWEKTVILDLTVRMRFGIVSP